MNRQEQQGQAVCTTEEESAGAWQKFAAIVTRYLMISAIARRPLAYKNRLESYCCCPQKAANVIILSRTRANAFLTPASSTNTCAFQRFHRRRYFACPSTLPLANSFILLSVRVRCSRGVVFSMPRRASQDDRETRLWLTASPHPLRGRRSQHWGLHIEPSG